MLAARANLRCFVAAAETLGLPDVLTNSARTLREGYFCGAVFGPLREVYDGERFDDGMSVTGVAVVEQANTSVVVFASQQLAANRFGDIEMER